MSLTDAERIADVLHHARHAMRTLGDSAVQDLGCDAVRLQAVVFDILVIGEALHHVSPDVQGLSPEIPWRAAWRTRNRLIHAYWNIDPDIVRSVVTFDLPHLLRALDALTRRLGAQPP